MWARIWWVRPVPRRMRSSVKPGKRLDGFPIRQRRAPGRQAGGHAGAVSRIARDRLLDPAGAFPSRPPPAPDRSFRRLREANCAARSRCAASVLATSRAPLVKRSRRCTMPGRRSPPTAERSWKRCSSAFTTVPAVDARARVNHHAGGLVDDDGAFVLVKDGERDVLRGGRRGASAAGSTSISSAPRS